MLLSPQVFSTLKVVPPKQTQTIGVDMNVSKQLFNFVDKEVEVHNNIKKPKAVRRNMRLAQPKKVSKECHTLALRKRKRRKENVSQSRRGRAVGEKGGRPVSEKYLFGTITAKK